MRSSLAPRTGGGPSHAPSVSIPSPIARLLGDEDSGQIQHSNSIVMNAKLQGHKSGLAEPYFASRAKGRKVETGEVAQLRNKAAAISRDFQNLLVAHERQEASMTDLRQKVRALRSELEARDKAVDLARRTVERLAAEKGQLEAAAAGTQVYVRKLEARLLAAKSAVELEQRCDTLSSLLDQQAAELHGAEARAESAEEAAERARLDTACLQRGLELAAEQLTRAAGAEIPGTLLRAVARGQEEAVMLGRQLADAKQQVSQLTEALEQAREHLEQQQEALVQQRAEGGALRRRAEEAEAKLERQAAATEELRRVLDALKPKAGAVAEERDGLLQQLELERTAAAEARREVDQLRAALRHKSAVERALRDELRRVLAGEGCTPSPKAARQQAQSPLPTAVPGLRRAAPGAGQRAGAGSTAAAGSRPPSRIGGAGQQRLPVQRQQQSGRLPAAAQAGKRPGLSVPAGGKPANNAVVERQASAWEQHQVGEQEGGAGGGGSGGASPLLRQQHQLSLSLPAAGVQGQHCQQQQPHLEVPAQPAWPQHEPSWLQDLHFPPAEHQRPPISNGAAPAAADAEHQHTPPQQARQVATGRPPLPQQLVQAQQRQAQQRRFVSALDQQIAQLESDIVQLTSAPSPIAHLQQRTAAGSLLGSSGQAVAEQPAAAVAAPPPKKQQAEQLQQEATAQQGGIAAWRPNCAFDEATGGHAAAPATACAPAAMQQQEAALGVQQDGEDPVPNLWHCNPLAGSPAKLPKAAAPAAAQRAHSVDGATTVRPLLSPEADPAAPAGTTSFGSQQQGGQPLPLHQQYGVSSPATHPAGGEAGPQPGHNQLPAPDGLGLAIELQPRPQGSTGIRACSITNQWELPSPGSATSDWLSNDQRHANIEQLEVTCARTPLQGLQPQLGQPASGGSAAVSTRAAAPATLEQQAAHQRRETPLLPGLPVQSSSPLPPHSQAAAAVPDQLATQQQQHTLFDLAGMDMQDLLAGC